jgi:anti-sigma B factor antagonist
MTNPATPIRSRLTCSVRTEGGVNVADLAGELDLASAPALREQLLGLLRPGSSGLVLDLSRVSFCDSSGLAVVVGTGRRARLLGGFLRLAAVSPPVARMMQLTGLHRHLPVFPTVEAALHSPPAPHSAQAA